MRPRGSLGSEIDFCLQFFQHVVIDRLGEVVEAGGLFGREIAGCDEAINAVGDRFASALVVGRLEGEDDPLLRGSLLDERTAREETDAEEADQNDDQRLEDDSREEFDGLHDFTFP